MMLAERRLIALPTSGGGLTVRALSPRSPQFSSGRSLTNYLERLIERDAEKKKRR